MVQLLDRLAEAGVRLATATAKRTEVAVAILAHHGLADRLVLINGTDDPRTTKQQTIGAALHELDAEGETAIMVGDRHYDVAGARACGVLAVGAAWGYGSRDELARAGADRIIDHPADLLGSLDL